MYQVHVEYLYPMQCDKTMEENETVCLKLLLRGTWNKNHFESELTKPSIEMNWKKEKIITITTVAVAVM